MNKRFKLLLVYLLPAIVAVTLVVVVNTTNPIKSGPLVILFVFSLLYVFVLSFLVSLYHFVCAVTNTLRPHTLVRTRRAYYILSVFAMAPVLLVALNTLGRLEVVEVMLVLALVSLGCFYAARRAKK